MDSVKPVAEKVNHVNDWVDLYDFGESTGEFAGREKDSAEENKWREDKAENKSLIVEFFCPDADGEAERREKHSYQKSGEENKWDRIIRETDEKERGSKSDYSDDERTQY